VRDKLPHRRGQTLCILAVPVYMCGSDVISFIRPDHMQFVRTMRIIRDKAPNRYMVLMTFNSQDTADAFYTEFNGHPFSSLEKEVCTVLYVAHVEMLGGAIPQDDDWRTELPTCPVCLERLDSTVSGIMTILCNHTFHCSCLVILHRAPFTIALLQFMHYDIAACPTRLVHCLQKTRTSHCLLTQSCVRVVAPPSKSIPFSCYVSLDSGV
jgi:hypothetical protein